MNPEGGYTRSYRRLWENSVFRSKQEAAVFCWMKDAAQWRATTIRTKFGPVKLGVGELLVAEREVAEDFGLHRNTYRSLMGRMTDAGMIEMIRDRDRCPYHAGTIVRILKYKEYQGFAVGPDDGQDRSRDRSETDGWTDQRPMRDRSDGKTETNARSGKDKEAQDVAAASAARQDRSETDAETRPDSGQDQSRTENNEGKEGKKVSKGEENARARVSQEAKELIRTFDQARARVYGEELRRGWPSSTDSVTAERWLDLGTQLGIEREHVVGLVSDHLESKFRDLHQDGYMPPPDSLAFFKKSVERVLRSRVAPMSPEAPHVEHRQTSTRVSRAPGADPTLGRRVALAAVVDRFGLDALHEAAE